MTFVIEPLLTWLQKAKYRVTEEQMKELLTKNGWPIEFIESALTTNKAINQNAEEVLHDTNIVGNAEGTLHN